jgi:beta-lactam-binding protein with PASTA domain
MLRGATIALAVVLGLVLPPGPAGASAAGSLTLDPRQGLPGATVRVTPETATSPEACVAFFDDQEVARFTCGTNSDGVVGSTDVVVPQVAPGPHTIRVCQPECGVEPAFEMSAPFTVLAVVPDLGGLTLAEARDRLRKARLGLGAVDGPGADPAARVAGQDPPPGSPVRRRSVVNVTMVVPTPLVTVPDLRGRTRSEAAALLEPLGLHLLVSSGAGRVRTQRPAAGDQVPTDSTVEVTLRAVPPPVLVTVPDLRRRSLADARAAVAAAGLVLRAGGATTGTVATQTPAPGTRAPRGSVVAVTMAAAAAVPPSRSWVPAAVALAAVLVAVTVAATAIRGLRRRRQRRWVREHVRVVAGSSPGGAAAGQVDEVGPGPTRSVGLQPHPDHGTQTLEEVPR